VNVSLKHRAVWVAAAAVGFWVLAIGLTLLLVEGGVAILEYAPGYDLAAFMTFALAGALAFGAMPRVSFKPEESSPPLGHDEHPRLHSLVKHVAERTGARAPEALFVTHDANAFAGSVRLRRFARRQRSVGIGLPLLAVLTQKEASAVIAHEMGHHVGGDVRLGPWVHRTRRAIARAVDRLEGSSFWFHLPFVAYAEFFMKTSVKISRAQELQADAVSAKVAGAAAAASALRKIEVLSAAWQAYFRGEVLPVLNKSRLPPLLDGFDRYWRAAQTPGTPAFDSLSAAMGANDLPGPADTHPPLAERIAALGDPQTASDATDATELALDLLDDVPRVEESVMRDLLRDPKTALKPVSWELISDEVWLPAWREAVKEHAVALGRLTASALPGALLQWEPLAQATRRGLAVLSPEAERRELSRLLGAWLTVRLADRGFRVDAQPGLAVVALRGGHRLEPYALVEAMLKSTPERSREWAKTCEELGI
jgi:Zn-dependent protease with chaperone function